MDAARDAEVIVVGAGPVGITLALDLASRGVEVLVLERRAADDRTSVKTNHISARSMETFRRLGLADAIRAVGLPEDHPHDCAYRTTLIGHELGRTPLASTAAKRARADSGADAAWPTPEPPHRVNQTFVEPILHAAVEAAKGIRILYRVEVSDVRQDGGSASVLARDLGSGLRREFRARFVVGCDGPGSAVRRRIGAHLEGPPMTGRMLSTLIRSPELMERMPHPPAWSVSVFNPRRHGAMITIDGREQFLLHSPLLPDEDYAEVDRGRVLCELIGADDVDYEILSIEDFTGRGLVASTYRVGRVFLAGDAAHLWLPFAGYGMNAGIADAVDLAWLLAAHLQGWAPQAILDAYEAERRPVTVQVSHHTMGLFPKVTALAAGVPAEIEDDSAAGEAARAEFGERAISLNTPQYAAAGLNFGYFYDGSPIISYDGEPPPPYTMGDFKASTVPGCRVPHLWLDDGRSLLDAIGPAYTLIRAEPAVDVTPIRLAAERAGVPLELVDLGEASGYDHPLVIARADHHVAWRGRQAPEDPATLFARLTGRSSHPS